MDASRRVRVVSGGRSVVIDAQPSWNLLFLRQIAASRLNLASSVSDRQLVLAGRPLPDFMLVSDLQPAEDTCLHLAAATPAASNAPTDPAVWRSWRRFFVFCRTCADVREARLRLHCARCGSGAFLLPSPTPAIHSFADLTTAGVQGRCDDCGPADMGFSLRCDTGESHECVPLPRLRANFRVGGYECLACLETVNGPLLHFPCAAEHCLCLPCFRAFADEAFTNQRFRLHPRHGWTLFCPACPHAAIDDPHIFLILGNDFYSRVKARGAEAALVADGGGFCAECGEAWLPASGAGQSAGQCAECGARVEVGAGREEEEGRMEVPMRPPSPESMQSVRTVRSISRRCPGCRCPTERNGGCMHMTCARCGFEWCWICAKEWSAECQAEHWFA